ncbi:MAG: PQQ-dependent sugar dehydrogenase, partial [Planctomycetota bacterium]
MGFQRRRRSNKFVHKGFQRLEARRRLRVELLEARRVLTGVPGSPVLELDAEVGIVDTSGLVSEWQDQSGSGNDVFSVGSQRPLVGAATTPTGLAAVSFDGINDRLLRDLGAAGGITGLPEGNGERSLFLVARFHDASATGGVTYGSTGVGESFGAAVTLDASSQGLITREAGGSADLVSTDVAFDSSGTQGWTIISAIHEDDGTNPADNSFLYRDGLEIAASNAQLSTNLQDFSLAGSGTDSRIAIGESLGESGHQQVDIAAVVAYDTALNESDREAVESYLYSRYLVNRDLSEFSDEVVIDDGLNIPISLEFLPDGRMLVLEKGGTIFLADPATGNRVEYMRLTNISSGQERGLLDITLSPDFDPDAPGEDYLYLYYTPGNPTLARIARFTHIENDGGLSSQGDASSEFVVWEDTEGYVACCHYGGGLDIGPDGKLWLTTSDKFTAPVNGEGGPDDNLPQDLTTGGGKVIRVNRDGTVPDGLDGWAANPFINPVDDDPNVPGNQDYHDYIWDFGLRNPFRASWDIESGRFFIAEVGGNQHSLSHEDIHIATLSQSGLNHGWPYYEGTDQTSTNLDPNGQFAPTHGFGASRNDTTAPLYSRPHNGAGASITGGEVYRGDQFPQEWDGVYFYGDFTNDFIRYLSFDDNGNVTGDFPFKPTADLPGPANQVVFIGVGADGALYYTLIAGEIRRVVHASANRAPEFNDVESDATFGAAAPAVVNFTASVSDPDGDAIFYEWFYGDGSSSGQKPVPPNGEIAESHTYPIEGAFSSFLELSDGSVSTFSSFLPIQIGIPNDPPVISDIVGTPASGSAPHEVFLSASVSDPNGDALTYQWIFGDGSSSGVNSVPGNGQISDPHTYQNDGLYDALLVVSDGEAEVEAFAPTIVVGNVNLPPVTNGLVMLLESDIKVPLNQGSTTVTGWLDQSGRGNNLTGFGDPQLVSGATPGGQPAIVFDGVGDKLQRPAAETINNLPFGDQDRTVIAVVNYEQSNNVYAGFVYGDASPNQAFGLVTNRSSGNLAVQGWGLGNDFTSGAPGEGSGWLTQTAIFSSGVLNQFLDGTLIRSDNHQFDTDITDTDSKIIIGESIESTGTSAMSLGAVMVFDRALSSVEQQQVEEYLYNKYFVGITPPTTQSDSALVALSGSVTVNVLSNDSASGGLDLTSVTIVDSPSGGVVSVDAASGRVIYDHGGGSAAFDSFSYTVDGLNGVTSSPELVTITIDAGDLITDSLVLQFESDSQVATTGQIVTGWIDSSGQGNDLQTVGGDPELVQSSTPSGLPAIAFDGDDRLSRENAIDGLNQLPDGIDGRSMFLVARYRSASSTAGASYGTPVDSGSFGLTLDGTSDNLSFNGFGSSDVPTAEQGTDAWLVQSVSFSNSVLSHFRDGQFIGESPLNLSTDISSTNSRLVLGGSIDGIGYADMDLAAVLIYDRTLTDLERQQVQAYLHTKYLNNFSSNTPPTFTSSSNVVVDENQVEVVRLTAVDPNDINLTFSVVGGVDGSLFETTGFGGEDLRFVTPPDFENPSDVDQDNVYQVDVAVSDGVDSTVLSMVVTVEDVVDTNAPPVFTSPSSVSVPENTTGVVTLTANDANQDVVTFSIVGGVDQGFFELSGTNN